jgi:preprotein translocase subunit SecG
LQQLNDLSQDIEQAASIKKTLTRSNTALILLACTMLISSICLGYVSKSKYNEIQVKKERLQQVEYQTQQKIAEYSKITTDLYKARGGR